VFSVPYLAGGRSEAGADCWGLVVLFYRKHFNVELPTFDDVVPDKTDHYVNTAEGARRIKETVGAFREVQSIEFGDVVLCNIIGLPIHVGIVVSKNEMLHAMPQSTYPVIERFTGLKWQRRIQSFHRLK